MFVLTGTEIHFQYLSYAGWIHLNSLSPVFLPRGFVGVTRSLTAARTRHFQRNKLLLSLHEKVSEQECAGHVHIQTLTHMQLGQLLSVLILSLFKHEPAPVLWDAAANEALVGEQTNREEPGGEGWWTRL